jgi:hypothetical protein
MVGKFIFMGRLLSTRAEELRSDDTFDLLDGIQVRFAPQRQSPEKAGHW